MPGGGGTIAPGLFEREIGPPDKFLIFKGVTKYYLKDFDYE